MDCTDALADVCFMVHLFALVEAADNGQQQAEGRTANSDEIVHGKGNAQQADADTNDANLDALHTMVLLCENYLSNNVPFLNLSE